MTSKIINGDDTISYYRSIHEVTTHDNMNLIMIRKTPIDRKPKAPVMLVHGLGQNRYSWTLSRRSFENYLIAEGFETFNVELRGHGLSRANGSIYPETFETYLTADMPAFVNAIADLTNGKTDFEEEIRNLTIPILFINGDRDVAVPEAAVREAYEKAGSRDKIFKVFGGEIEGLHWGHIDLILGRHAPEITWPYMRAWMNQRI